MKGQLGAGLVSGGGLAGSGASVLLGFRLQDGYKMHVLRIFAKKNVIDFVKCCDILNVHKGFGADTVRYPSFQKRFRKG